MGTADVCIDHMADWPIDKSDDLKKLLGWPSTRESTSRDQPLLVAVIGEIPLQDTHDPVKRLYDKFGPKRLLGEPIGRWARRTAATPRRWCCTATSCHTSPQRIGAGSLAAPH